MASSNVSPRETNKQRRDLDTGTEAATRTADVLLLFTTGPAFLGVSEIARQLGLSKAVVFRILRSLASRHLLELDAGVRAYRLGPAAAALGARALRGLDLRQVALPILQRLQSQTGETATVSALVGESRVYLDQVPSLKEIKMTVELGRSFPLHVGASSRAILAFAAPGLRESVLVSTLAALTLATSVIGEELRATLAEVRRQGTAVSYGERQVGAGSVAAPVLGIDRHAIGSISVCGPVDRFTSEVVEHIRPLVREAAREISLQVGWDGVLP